MSVIIDVVSKFNEAGIAKARNELDRLAGSTKSTSQKMMQGAAVAGAGIIAGAGAIGVSLLAIGTQFDDAFDRIRIGTGATGAALEALQGDMKAVAGAVPTSFADAGTAVTEFSRRLGLTGDPLQTLSKQVLELSRITNTDLNGNIAAVAQVMQNFGVAATDQSGKLDVLFRASQKSGVSVADLAGQMSDAGVVLRELGLGFDQSAALLATLGRAGIDVGSVMPAMSKALAVAAKQGKDASTVFSDTFAAIKDAPSDVDAAGVALEVFGAKAGPKLAAMIREGKLSYEEMSAALANGDSILKAGQDTQDFGEKLTVLKNRVFLAIEPIATRVFNAIGDAVDQLGPKIEQLTAWMTEHGDTMKIVAIVVGGVLVAAIAAYTAGMVAAAAATIAAGAPILAIVAVIAALVAGLVWAYNNVEWFRNAVDKAWEVIRNAYVLAWNYYIEPVFTAIVWYIQNVLIPGYKVLWEAIKAAFENIANIVSWAWNNVIKPAWTAISWYIENILVPYWTILWNVAQEVFGAIAEAVSNAWNNIIKPIWDAIYWYIENILVPYYTMLWDVVQTVFNAVGSIISWVWNTIIQPAFQNISNGISTLIGVFNTIKDGVTGAFSTIFDIVTSPFRMAFNFIADAWNNTVGKLSFDVPDWVPFVGGKSFSMPTLPKFASGGMFNTPMSGGAGLAILHDNEMVLNPQQQKALFSGSGLGGGPTVNVVINTVAGDPAAIERVVLDAIGRAHVRGMTALKP